MRLGSCLIRKVGSRRLSGLPALAVPSLPSRVQLTPPVYRAIGVSLTLACPRRCPSQPTRPFRRGAKIRLPTITQSLRRTWLLTRRGPMFLLPFPATRTQPCDPAVTVES